MKEFLVEQLELITLQLDVARLLVVEAQERSLAKPCKLSRTCLLCKAKRKILRGRKDKSQ